MMNKRDLIQRLVDALEDIEDQHFALLYEARAVLNQPEPEELTDEEILNLSEAHDVSYTRPGGSVIYLYEDGTDMRDDVLSFARAIIAADRARWGRPAVEPVPEESAKYDELRSTTTTTETP